MTINKPVAKRPVSSALIPLSLRELEVVQLALKGFNKPQIVIRLFLTRDTVQCHNETIRHKCGLPPRVAMTKAMVELAGGLSPVEGNRWELGVRK